MAHCDAHSSMRTDITVDKSPFCPSPCAPRVPTSPEDRDLIFSQSGLGPQAQAPNCEYATDISSFKPPLFAETTIPTTYTANYASFSTSFLTAPEIEQTWEEIPIVIHGPNAVTTLKTHFLDVVGQIFYPHFTGRIKRGSVIDPFGLNTSSIKYFATYSHLMVGEMAYIRLVAYNRQGLRCHAAHPEFGNRILAIPRSSNDVIFPVPLRFHALHATEICHYPDESHNRIRKAAWSYMTPLERVWWESGRCGICDTDL